MPEPMLGEIRVFGFGFVPQDWLPCDGRTLPIEENQALHSIIGTMYGGDGVKTFNLPDYRGRTPVGVGVDQRSAPGNRFGNEYSHLPDSAVPRHDHWLYGSDGEGNEINPTGRSIAGKVYSDRHGTLSFYKRRHDAWSEPLNALSTEGEGTPINNVQPFLALNFCICVHGIYPSRS